MNIGLINTYSYNNIGDAAIYAALSQLLKQYSVFSTLQENNNYRANQFEYKKNISQCDAFVSVGGDIFNNTRPWLLTRNYLNNIKQLSHSPQTTFLFGQSIPASCHGLALKLLCRQFKQLASVVVRDQQSYNALTNLGVPCSLSYDTAFILSPSKRAIKMAAEILTQLKAPRSAVISIREFNPLYPVDNTQFIKKISFLCSLFRERNYQPVLLIQSHVSMHDTDRTIAHAIKQQCPEVKILDLFEYSSLLPSWELLQAILMISRLVVAVRYHTAILALAAGRTPFNLFYSNKGADLSSRLGIPGCHIEQFNPARSFNRIEQTGHKIFNPQPMINSIHSSFNRGLDRCHFNSSLEGCYEHA